MPEYPGTIYITHHAFVKLNAYAAEALPNEIGGLARLRDVGNGDMIVIDVRMFEQEASGASFVLEDDMMTKFTLELVKAGKGEEIPEWCSIVHSHPVGMSAHMSNVDVSAIERFAMDQDAFSLIIPASHNANTPVTGLLMHYCVSNAGRAGKIIIRDTPVQMATTTSRIELGKQVFDLIAEKCADASDEEKVSIASLARRFATDTLPGIWKADVDALRAEAKEMVPKLVKNRYPTQYTHSSQWPRAAAHHPAGFHDRNLQRMDENEWEAEWHAYANRLPAGTRREAPLDERSDDDLDAISRGIDPGTGLQVGRRRMRKAKCILLDRRNASQDAPDVFAIGDYVAITEAGVERLITLAKDGPEMLEAAELFDTPVKVTAIDSNFYYVEGDHAVFHWEMEACGDEYDDGYLLESILDEEIV